MDGFRKKVKKNKYTKDPSELNDFLNFVEETRVSDLEDCTLGQTLREVVEMKQFMLKKKVDQNFKNIDLSSGPLGPLVSAQYVSQTLMIIKFSLLPPLQTYLTLQSCFLIMRKKNFRMNLMNILRLWLIRES